LRGGLTSAAIFLGQLIVLDSEASSEAEVQFKVV
jgi:hypothetical protein